MNDQAVFYALSTLAQTCAALAAFVGAVGVYRLQSLRDKRHGLLGSIRARRGNPTEDAKTLVARAAAHAKAQKDHELQDLVTRHDQVAPTIRRNVSALCFLRAASGLGARPPSPASRRGWRRSMTALSMQD
jgi:hypothetical protein